MVKIPYEHGPDCPVYESFNLMSKRGVLLIIKSLGQGHHQFCQIKKECYNLNNKSLTDKLQELMESGLVEKRNTGTSCYDSYYLTARGEQLAVIVNQLADWSRN